MDTVNYTASTPSVVSENDLRRKKSTWERRLDEAKIKHRPKLKDWSRDGFATRRNSDFELLRSILHDDIRDLLSCPVSIDSDGGTSFHECRDIDNHNHSNCTASTKVDNKDVIRTNYGVDKISKIDRIKCKNISPDQFIGFYEKRGLPCVISGIPKREHWAAQRNWNFKRRLDRDRSRDISVEDDQDESLIPLGESYFKVGEDDDGYKVKVKLKYFLKYLSHNRDDSPLYVFDRCVQLLCFDLCLCGITAGCQHCIYLIELYHIISSLLLALLISYSLCSNFDNDKTTKRILGGKTVVRLSSSLIFPLYEF